MLGFSGVWAPDVSIRSHEASPRLSESVEKPFPALSGSSVTLRGSLKQAEKCRHSSVYSGMLTRSLRHSDCLRSPVAT